MTSQHNSQVLAGLKLIGYTFDKPTEDGWYFVIFEPNDMPSRVYLHVSEYGIAWGYNKEDDPEMIESATIFPDLVLYKKAA